METTRELDSLDSTFRQETIAKNNSTGLGNVLITNNEYAKGLLWIIGITIVSTVTLLLIPIKEKIVATGVVVPKTGVREVRSIAAGEIKFAIEDGKHVDEGDKIFSIRKIQKSSNTGLLIEKQISNLHLEEKRNLEYTTKKTDQLNRTRAQVRKKIIATQRKIDSIKREISIHNARVETVNGRLELINVLTAEHAASKLEKNQAIENLYIVQQLAAQLETKLEQEILNLVNIKLEEIATSVELDNTVYEFESKIADINRQLLDLNMEVNFDIVANSAGNVSLVKSWEHKVVNMGDLLAYIIPDDNEFVVELILPPIGAGRVQQGQNVNIKFYALPFEKYGTLSGRIRSVSLAPTNEFVTKSDTPKVAPEFTAVADLNSNSSHLILSLLKIGMDADISVAVGSSTVAEIIFRSFIKH